MDEFFSIRIICIVILKLRIRIELNLAPTKSTGTHQLRSRLKTLVAMLNPMWIIPPERLNYFVD